MDRDLANRFRVLLEADKARILGNTKNAIDQLTEQTKASVGDEGDEAQALCETHLSLRFRDRERQLLDKIDNALTRIREGVFGECQECGEDIGMKRLESRPIAILCIRCKEAEERNEKSYVSP